MTMPASTKAGGVCVAMPNTCLVPGPQGSPVLTPLPNIAQVAAATGTVSKVLIKNKETVIKGWKIPNSSGDEAGVLGGVVSGVNMGTATTKVASSKVMVAGKRVVFATALVAHNGAPANMPIGAQVGPSQVKVFVGV